MKKTCSVLMFILLFAPGITANEKGKEVTREGFTFVLPERWTVPKKEEQQRGRRKAKEKIVSITKDGFLLDEVRFTKHLITAEFTHTKKQLKAGMMPQEMAEVVLNDFELNERMKNFKVVENKPAAIGGNPGFRLVYSYRMGGTLQYQCVYYGFQKNDMFYSIFYEAPKRHYFEINLPTFEEIVKSFKFEAPGSGPTGFGDSAN